MEAASIISPPEPKARANESPVPEFASTRALAAFGLQKSYGRRRVVDDVTLHVEPGEGGGLLGANGAGKRTTFYMIIGLETPEAGHVTLVDQEVTRLPMYLRARLGLGYLPQEPCGFPK